jgi:hypothetical protein
MRLTSQPTHRSAYVETRRVLLAEHGPICAYCGRVVDEGEITLDHVTPRKGRTAYDRRDNLVLSCRRCNALKADKPILAFLLSDRKRAAHMVRYGQHLSIGLRQIAAELAPEAAAELAAEQARTRRPRRERIRYGADEASDSPYADDPQPSPYAD